MKHGNVGIGTTNPSQSLEVDGNIKLGNGGSLIQSNGGSITTEEVSAMDGDGLKLYDDGGTGLFIQDGGRVGIGTTNPSFPLDVASHTYSTQSYGYLNVGGNTGTASGNCPYSIRAYNRIMASEFNAVSDKRIKNRFVYCSTTLDLENVNKLKVTRYNYIDSISQGTEKHKGFIAQQVREVMPEAVTLKSDFIPDVFALATKVELLDGKIILEIPKNHSLVEGEMIKLITKSGQHETKVVEVISDRSFAVLLDEHPENVFVFGKKIDNFHVLNYDYIFTSGISAIQELSKRNNELSKEYKKLSEKSDDMEARIEKLESALYQFAEVK